MSSADDRVSDDLVPQVLAALLELRARKGQLTPQKLARFPVLVSTLGSDDLLDAFMAFRRELRRYIVNANRDEAAAAMSIYAKAETVLDRLEYTALRLSDTDDLKDQRSARRWSDAGMPHLAEDLVYMARIQRRLGREMLHIELHDADRGGLLVVIEQMVHSDLDVTAPEVTLWAMHDNGDPEELHLDLGDYPATEAAQGEYRMIRQRVLLTQELLHRITPERSLTLAVTGRDAPTRTVSWRDHATTITQVATLSTYRNRCTVELNALKSGNTTAEPRYR